MSYKDKVRLDEEAFNGIERDIVDYTGKLCSRRKFLTTASIASAGILISPLDANGKTTFWADLGSFFKDFAQNLLFTYGMKSIPGWGGDLPGVLNKPSWLNYVIGGCFGYLRQMSPTPTNPNGSKGTNRTTSIDLNKVLTFLGSESKLNAGAAYQLPPSQGGKSVQAIFPAPSYIGIGKASNAIFNSSALQNKDEAFKNQLFLPNMKSPIFGQIALESLGELSGPKLFSEPYRKPQLYESENGGFILIQYDVNTKTYGGEGLSTILPVLPDSEEAEAIRERASRNSDFWSNEARRKELIKAFEEMVPAAMKKAAKSRFNYEVPK